MYNYVHETRTQVLTSGACALLSDQPANAVEQVRTGDSSGAGGATAGGGDEKTEKSRVQRQEKHVALELEV